VSLGLGERVRTLAWVQDPFRDHLLEQAIEEPAGPSGGCGMGSSRETLHRIRERGDLTMIMRITWGRIHPGTWEEYEKTYNATVVAKSKNIKGLRGRWLAQDTADKDAGYSVSLWDSAEDMEAYEQSEFFKKEILAPLQPFHINAFTTTRCDVKYAQEFK
jgi:heme-degrading monooxygenase HmoA